MTTEKNLKPTKLRGQVLGVTLTHALREGPPKTTEVKKKIQVVVPRGESRNPETLQVDQK